jgi:hypothetical protein
MEHAKEIGEIKAALARNGSAQVIRGLRQLDASYNALKGNFLDFHVLVMEIKQQERALKLMRDEQAGGIGVDDFMIEVSRRLHNYLASAYSQREILDITMPVAFQYSPLLGEYRGAAHERLDQSPLANFIRPLRGYVQHFELLVPPVSMHWTLGPPPTFDTKVYLNVEELRQDQTSGWNRLSREYISSLGEEVELIDVLKDYQDVIDSFMRWLLTRVDELHRPSLDEYESLFNRIAYELYHVPEGFPTPLTRPIFRRLG